MKTIFVFILLFVFIGVSAPINHKSKIKRIAYIEVGPIEQPDYILKSFKFIESSYREKVIGDNGKAYGCLQFHQARVDDINEIVGYKKYTLKDALIETRATEMWYVYMAHKNPTYNLERACLLWNGKWDDPDKIKKYFDKITKQLSKLL